MSKMASLKIMVRFCLLIVAWLLPARSVALDGTGRDPELVRQINTLLEAPDLQAGFQGILIQSLADKSTLYEHNSDHTFLPASNNKLLTSCAALAVLGTDFAYHTRLIATAPLAADGTLHGDLILVGVGDPLLSPPELADMVRQAVRKGLKRLTGRVSYDDSLFDRQRLGDTWAWDDETYYYSAQISALNCNENMVYCQVTPGRRVGTRARLAVGPISDYATVINQTVTGPPKSKSTITFARERGQNSITASGNIPLDADPKTNLPTGVTIENPSRFAASVLRTYLQAAHVRLDHSDLRDASPHRTTSPNSASNLPAPVSVSPLRVLAEHVSPTLPTLLKRLNKPSDNLVAECLLKTVGAIRRGQGTGGDEGTAVQTARTVFQSLHFDITRLHQADGSGLSRTNWVSPHFLVQLLTHQAQQPDFAALYDSLPVAGVDGSLRNRMKDTPARGNCHAKTGYVSQASSISGYVTTKSGEKLVFSMLMNGHLCPNRVCTAIQDKIVALLAAYTPPISQTRRVPGE